MNIIGFQKMTLLDYPGKVACTIFTAGCNFRCPFCHNASLVTHIDNSNKISENEILDFLKKRQGLIDGVCITGGEPLLNDDIDLFIKNIKDLGYLVKLDTNGSFPEKLEKLINSGLIDYVAMDIKNCKEKYHITTDCENINITNINKSVELLLKEKVDYEFRTTIVNELHTIDDVLLIGEWIKGAKRYFLQNFVDSGDLIAGDMSAVDSTVLCNMQQKVQQFVVNTEIRGI